MNLIDYEPNFEDSDMAYERSVDAMIDIEIEKDKKAAEFFARNWNRASDPKDWQLFQDSKTWHKTW